MYFKRDKNILPLLSIPHTGVATTGGERSASVVTLIATGKAAVILTVRGSDMSVVGAVVAEVGVAVEGRAGTGSTEEAEVRTIPM